MLNKKNIFIFVLIFSSLVVIAQSGDVPEISFVLPTPLNETTTTNTSIEINVSIKANLSEVKFNWNGTNYTIYNDSLVLMYNFDNVSALGENDTYVVDVSKYGNDGTMNSSGPNWTSSGKYGGAFEFDGVDDFINISDDDSLDVGTEDFSISLWMKTSHKENRILIAKGGVSDQSKEGYKIQIANNHSYFWHVYDGANVTYKEGNVVITDGVWHHIVGVFDRDLNGTLYVDGVFDVTQNISNITNLDNPYDLLIGTQDDFPHYFNGTIDEVRIWNISLSADEIQQLYFTNLRKYDTDKWSLYVNQSKNSTAGLVDGDYTYFASAKDEAGNENLTEERQVTVEAEVPLTVTLISPANNSNFNTTTIEFVTNYTDIDLKNATLFIWNSTNDNINKTTQTKTGTSNSSNISVTLPYDDAYEWNYYVCDDSGNCAWNATNWTVTVDTGFPAVSIVSPANNTNSSDNLLDVNYTVSDTNLQACWYSNDTMSANTTLSPCGTNITDITWSEGQHNVTIWANDSAGNENSSSVTFTIDSIKMNCEAGGPYQQGALVLVQGNVSYAGSALASQAVNTSIYDSDNNINTSKSLTTADDGGFETTFSGLSVGSYTLNASTTYQGINKFCTDTFQVGSSASFVLDKIATVHNVTNTTINYNITLRLTNKGGSDATNSNISDSDSEDSPYDIGTLALNSSVERSYIENYTRQASTTYQLLAVAVAQGINPYLNSVISVNSTELNLTIPATPVGKNILIVKNVVFSSENSTAVIYNVSSILYNIGDEDLISINYIDTDLNSTAFTIDLDKGDSNLISELIEIDKAASNTNHQFALGTATISGLNFYSNRPTVRIPGYGGPADVDVYVPASVQTSTSFDTIIQVENKNPDIGQDFTFDYWITNNDETTNYSSGQKTAYVSASNKTNKTATLTSPSSAGTYRFRALVSWAGGTASAFDSFIVTAPAEEEAPSAGGGGGVTGKATEIICEPPYIRHGAGCCLDANNNSICDGDEKPAGEIPEEEIEESEKEHPSEKPKPDIFDKARLYYRISLEYILKNKIYFIIVFGGLIFVLLLIILIKIIKRKRRTQLKYAKNKIRYLEAKVRHLEKLKKRKKIKKLKSKTFLIIIFSLMLIGLLFVIENDIIGFVVGESNIKSSGWNIFGFILIIGSLGLLIFSYKKKIKISIRRGINKIRRKYPKNSLKDLIKKKVYTEEGEYIGKVKEIILGDCKIDSLKIKLCNVIKKEKRIKNKGIVIKYRNVRNIKHIVIIDKRVSEHLEKLDSIKIK